MVWHATKTKLLLTCHPTETKLSLTWHPIIAKSIIQVVTILYTKRVKGQRWENVGQRSMVPAHTHAIGNKMKYTAERHDNPPRGVVEMAFTPRFKMYEN